jgi:hypothetical protein
MSAEFVGPLGRHGCDLQTIEPHLRIVLCVYNIQENRKPTTREMHSVICFLNARNMKLADSHRQFCEVYGEHAMSDSVVQRWVRHINEDLVNAVEEKIQENRRFTISSLSLYFS